MQHECYFCHIKTVEKLVEKFRPDSKTTDNLVFEIHKLLDENRKLSNPYLATKIHRIARKHLKRVGLYEEEKIQANDVLLKQYDYWKKIADNSENPFHTAAKLAVIGNIIDYGAHSVGHDISQQIKTCFARELVIDETLKLEENIKLAKSILYIGDNAGEIVFDKLFIETIKHQNITYAVRGKPVINDVTYDDIKQCGIDKYCTIVSNGFDAPSTLLEHCSDEFLKAYHNADVIISKGQGNFEGLMESDNHKIFFMLMAKCNPMANLLNVSKGDMVITQLKTK